MCHVEELGTSQHKFCHIRILQDLLFAFCLLLAHYVNTLVLLILFISGHHVNLLMGSIPLDDVCGIIPRGTLSTVLCSNCRCLALLLTSGITQSFAETYTTQSFAETVSGKLGTAYVGNHQSNLTRETYLCGDDDVSKHYQFQMRREGSRVYAKLK